MLRALVRTWIQITEQVQVNISKTECTWHFFEQVFWIYGFLLVQFVGSRSSRRKVVSPENVWVCVSNFINNIFYLADGETYQTFEKGVAFHKGISAHDTRPATQTHAEQPQLGRSKRNKCTTRIRKVTRKRRSVFRVGTSISSVIFNFQSDHLTQHSTYHFLNNATLCQRFLSDLSYSFYDYALKSKDNFPGVVDCWCNLFLIVCLPVGRVDTMRRF